MKTLGNLLLVTLFSTFISCDKIESAADIEFETSFEDDFFVDIQSPTEPDNSAKFSDSGTIDLTDGDVADYVDKLQNINVTKIEIRVASFAGSANAELSGDVDFGGGNLLTIPSTNLQDLFNNGGVINLSDQTGTFNHIKNELLNQKMLTYTLNGVLSEVPVTTDIIVKYTLDVVANPL